MESESSTNKNTSLKIILGVLVLIALFIGGAVVVMRMNKDATSDGADVGSNDGVNTILLVEDIDEKLNTDPNYGYEQASDDYRAAMSSGDNEDRLSVAFAYARYDYSVYQNADQAIKILEEVSSLADNDYLKYIYYGYLLYFYQEAGYEEKANNLIMLMSDLSPKSATNTTEDI